MKKIIGSLIVAGIIAACTILPASADWSWGGGDGGSGYDPSWSCYFGWC